MSCTGNFNIKFCSHQSMVIRRGVGGGVCDKEIWSFYLFCSGAISNMYTLQGAQWVLRGVSRPGAICKVPGAYSYYYSMLSWEKTMNCKLLDNNYIYLFLFMSSDATDVEAISLV